MERRVAWVDVAKGLGIVLVVWGHVFRGLVASGLASPTSPLQIVDYAIYTFHMPLFFFLAGIFAADSLAKGARRFWAAKVLRLVYPYFLWSLLQGGMQIALSPFVHHQISISDLARIPWSPLEQFWFLYALFWCHAGFIVLRRAGNPAMLAVAACLFGATFCVNLGTGSMVLWGFFYYAMGATVAQAIRNLSPSPWMALGLSLAFVAAVGGALATGMSSGAAIPAALCGIAATIALSHLLAPWAKFLRLLGYLSMSIYLMHVIAAAAVRILLAKVLHIDSLTIQMLLGTVAGVMLPVAAHLLLARTGLLAWAGLGIDFRRARPPTEPVAVRG